MIFWGWTPADTLHLFHLITQRLVISRGLLNIFPSVSFPKYSVNAKMLQIYCNSQHVIDKLDLMFQHSV